MIAIALIAKPEILLADEPSTALDVTVQAQILGLLQELRAVNGTAIVLVTHDLAVVAEIADRVAVMYAGQVVEQAGVQELFTHAHHPYTEGMKQFIASADVARPARLPTIDGSPPDISALPSGCAFAPRCRYRLPICEGTSPALLQRTPGHTTACHYPGPLG
jgi:oligopeptide/dipeptide ABC transporter ATP-binding protein